MDIYLNKEKINYVKNVLSTSLPHEETMEMIVPDALPDILRIVDTDAVVYLRSKSTDSGRVSVSGVAAATIIFAPDGESGVRKMDLEIPFTTSANDGEITQNTRVTASVSSSVIWTVSAPSYSPTMPPVVQILIRSTPLQMALRVSRANS